MELSWDQLICDQRYSASSSAEGKFRGDRAAPTRSAFEADYDRIIYSSAFRRLGKKTQVHPMETNAHIHNRLTHSLEVSSVSRTFSRKLINFLHSRGDLPCRCGHQCETICFHSANDLSHMMMAASLAHDIGNPPFGHAGEFAIRSWATDHQDSLLAQLDEPTSGDEHHSLSGLKQDLLLFEGNAQAFRICARQDVARAGYMRLTYSTIAAMVKYPWHSTDARAIDKKKYCFFSTEQKIADEVFSTMGLSDEGQLKRHPLSFLTEAADDICYSVVDIEDAVEMKILSPQDAKEHYLAMLNDLDGKLYPDATLTHLRAKAVGHLIDQFWQVFENNYDAIMRGQRSDDLRAGLPEHSAAAFRKVKATYEIIFSTAKKIRIEVGAYELLGRIIRSLSDAVRRYSQTQELKELPFPVRRCLVMAWEESWLRENAARPYCWWLHEVMDFISSLTDDEAYTISHAIAGVGRI
jgi:dGTPase